MKKYILILDELVYSFNSDKELKSYVTKYHIKEYTVALLYYEVENGKTNYSS